MLFHIQFPIVDLRSFAPQRELRLPVPGWPRPLVNEEFVRSVGQIRQRRRGGLEGWVGDEFYCDARRAIKLDLSKSRDLRIAFRRFYFDGAIVGRFEIGLALEESTREPSSVDLVALVRRILNLEAQIRSPGRPSKRFRLIAIAKPLARLYASASSKHRGWLAARLRSRSYDHLVIGGNPSLFIETSPIDLDQVNMPCGAIQSSAESNFRVFHWTTEIDGTPLPVWITEPPQCLETSSARKLRVYLIRLHAEHQAFLRILKAVRTGMVRPRVGTVSSEALQQYLNKSTRFFLRSKEAIKKISSGDDVLADAMSFGSERLIPVGDRNATLNQLKYIRKNIYKKIERLTTNAKGDEMWFTKERQLFVASIFGVAFLAILLATAIIIPNPTSSQETTFRIIMAISASAFAGIIPGVMDVKLTWTNFVLRASGALAVFVIVYFYAPA